jgi:hypothetical protein
MLLMPLSTFLSADEASAPPSIAGCEGFRVTGPRGRIGVVVEVCEDAGSGGELRVASGTWRLQSVVIPARDVVAVDPRSASLRVGVAAPHGGRAWQARLGRLAALLPARWIGREAA